MNVNVVFFFFSEDVNVCWYPEAPLYSHVVLSNEKWRSHEDRSSCYVLSSKDEFGQDVSEKESGHERIERCELSTRNSLANRVTLRVAFTHTPSLFRR